MAGAIDLSTYNLLVNDGAVKTLSPAELAIIDGLLATTAELNHMQNASSEIQAQLNAIDQDHATPIGVHKAIAGDHHAKYASGDLETDLTITIAKLMDAINYGVGNTEWITCIFSHGAEAGYGSQHGVTNTTTNNQAWCWRIPKDTARGALAFTVTDVEFYLIDADGSNFITSIEIRGVTSTGSSQKYSDSDDRSTVALFTSDGGALAAVTNFDSSAYYQVNIILTTNVATAYALEVLYVRVKGYYS